jgi:hypothetical protein
MATPINPGGFDPEDPNSDPLARLRAQTPEALAALLRQRLAGGEKKQWLDGGILVVLVDHHGWGLARVAEEVGHESFLSQLSLLFLGTLRAYLSKRSRPSQSHPRLGPSIAPLDRPEPPNPPPLAKNGVPSRSRSETPQKVRGGVLPKETTDGF